jgi:ABC-2 type transport system ATP-binding protein
LIQLNHIGVNYENLTAVSDVNLNLDNGKIHGLIGPNGAGKSSLINVCVGLIQEYEGEVLYRGHNIRKERLWIKKRLGFAPEDTSLMPYLTGIEFLNLIATVKKCENKKQKIDSFVSMLNLESKTNEVIIELSHGMKQKLMLASAFLGDPDFLIIDEALNGLDSVSLYNVQQYLHHQKTQGKNILIASHVIPLIREWCDEIHVMNAGKIIRRFENQELTDLEKNRKMDFQSIFMDLIR